MAVLGRLLVGSGERVDLQDLLSIDSYSAGDIKYLLKSLFGSSKPYIVKGFDVISPESSIGTQGCSIRVADSAVFYPSSSAGPFFHGLEDGNSLAEPLVPELRKNAVNYIYLTLSTVNTSTDTRAFWDPDKDGGAGGEFTQDINTESVLVANINVSVSSFPQNTIPIAKITVGPVVISAIEDCRDLLFRLGDGGLNPDPFSTYSWKSLPSSSYTRSEPANKMMAGGTNPFQGADKNINSLKEWMDAIMTKLKELGGTTYWYDDASAYSLISNFIDSCATAFQSKGEWLHDSSTPGLLTWTEDIKIKVASDVRNYILRSGNKVLSNDQVMYVEMVRNQPFNENNEQVDWVNGAAYINSSNGVVGSFSNLSKGDYVKKLNDTNDKYLRVEGFRDTLNGGGSSVSANLAKSVILSDVYLGTTDTERGIYDKGVYSGSEIKVADRNDPDISLLGGNFHWLAIRSDTVQPISDIETTELTISLSEDDGQTVKVTSLSPHGLNDGDRVYVSNSTNFNGEYVIEKETNTIFYIKKDSYAGPYADESGVSAYYATVTTTKKYAEDGVLTGIELESERHNFSTNDLITISDTSSYNDSYRISVIDETSFNIAVTSLLSNETSGNAVLAKTIVRTEGSVVQIVQGGSASIGGDPAEKIKQYVGMTSLSIGDPTYLVPSSYNTLDGLADYNSDAGENLTARAAKLTAMMADKAQDKTIRLSPSGFSYVKNTTNGSAQDIQFVATSTGPRLDVVLPGSENNGYVSLTGTLSLNQNQVAYIEINRNNSFSYASLSEVVKTSLNDLVIDENIFVIAYRLSNSNIWLWDGTRVVADTLITQAQEYIDTVIKVDLVDNKSSSLPAGASATIDGISLSNGNKVLFTNSGLNGVYLASGVGSSISWQQIESFAGNLAPYNGALVSVQSGSSGYATLWMYAQSKWRQVEHTQVNKEPTGFVNISESSISFTDLTRLFTISPTSTYFDIYQKGVPYIIASAKTTAILDVEGLHYIYFDDGVLYSTQTFDIGLIKDYVLVATVQWDSTNKKAIMLSEERHGLSMDGATHSYLHQSVGTRYVSGLSAGSYTTSGSGASNSDAQLSISDGVIFDEDLSLSIQDGVGIYGSNLSSGQDLSPIANIPVYYRTGASGYWRKDNATTYPVKVGSTYITYNNYSGGVWTTPDTDVNNYVAMWIFATNNIVEPVIAILGQREDNSLNAAQQNNTYESLSFGNLPSLEMKVLYRLIYEVKSSFTNAVKARLVDVRDLRRAIDVALGAYAPSDHGLLTGLTDQDHPDYAIYVNTPTAYVGGLKQINSTDNNDVQKALNSLDRFFAQLKIRPHSSDGNRVTISGVSQALTNSTILTQTIRNQVIDFDGAEIDFSTGAIYKSDGVTALGVNFTPASISTGQYFWYSIAVKSSTVNSDKTIGVKISVKGASASGASAALAPKAEFSKGIQLGSVVVKKTVSGIDPITASSIKQLNTINLSNDFIFSVDSSESGIAVGDAIYIDNTGKAYRVDSADSAKVNFVGIALDAGSGSLYIQSAGELDVGGSFTVGAPVYADPYNPGKLTSTAPTNIGHWTVQVGTATTTSAIMINGAGGATAAEITSAVSAPVARYTSNQTLTSANNVVLVDASTPTGWAEIQRIRSTTPIASELLGVSVAVSSDGTTMVAGANGYSSYTGAAYIYIKSGDVWVQTQKLLGISASDDFGYSVAISNDGSIIAIGAYGRSSSTGAVYIYTKSGTVWSLTQTLSGVSSNNFFGFSISMSGDGVSIAVGAYAVNGGTYNHEGRVYVYVKSGPTWSLTQTLSASDAYSDGQFGYSVAMSNDGSTMIIGSIAYYSSPAPHAGYAYIFTKSGGTWSETQKITPSDATSNKFFGHSVSISNSGAVVVVGANGDNGYIGAAYIFTKSGATWSQTQKLTPSDGASNDYFGTSVSVSGNGNVIGIGSPSYDIGTDVDSGAVYVFTKSGSTWYQTQKMIPYDSWYGGQFGYSVAVSNNSELMFVGMTENSSSLSSAGAIYVFDDIAVNIALPSPINGKVFTIKKIDNTNNLVTIDASGLATIDGELKKKISSQYDSFIIVGDTTGATPTYFIEDKITSDSVESHASSFAIDNSYDKKILLIDTNTTNTITAHGAYKNFSIIIKDKTGKASTNPISFVPSGVQKVEGLATTYSMNADYGSWTMIFDGTDWWIG